MTGKLSVTHIDTSCVLEVLVPVVLVGKYLATSVTLVALIVCKNEQFPGE
jgi:hypothetical protein